MLDRIDLDDITFNTTTGTGDTLSNGTWILRPDMDDMYVKVRDLLYKTKEAGSIDILA